VILKRARKLFKRLKYLPEDERIEIINQLRLMIHQESPFKSEPVDCVLWQPIELVKKNNYNPNHVGPPEMKLLEQSIKKDNFTMPIVSYHNGDEYEIVDGFHRSLIGQKLNKKYLPITLINKERSDRISSTIRHNRARGKHQVSSMSDIVIELKKRGWSDISVAREIGLDKDEILRLTQITGLTDMFENREFSEAWEHEESLV